MQPDAFADMVVLTIKTALGPVLERLAAAEARISMLPATDKTMAELRDRVVAVETKAAAPITAVDIPDLAPVLERVAAAEARLSVLGDLRDRVVAVETKAAMPLTPDAAIGELRDRVLTIETKEAAPLAADHALTDVRSRLTVLEGRDVVIPPPPIVSTPAAGSSVADLVPVLERVSAAEARLAVLGDLRDRVVAVETKASMPLAPDAAIGDLRDRVLTIETKAEAPTAVEHAVADMQLRLKVLENREVVAPAVVGEDLRDRVVTLETRAAGPSVTDMAVVDLRERVGSLERRVSDDKVTQDIAAIRERLAVAEVKAPVTGPAGIDGVNGKDGTDGMGWDDLSVAHDGERAFTVKMMRGDRVKDVGAFTLPVQIYRGVYTEGRTYEPGDTVTYARSLWHCHKTTVLKPDGVTRDPVTGEPKGTQGKDFWRLAVKGGQDGKDGRDGHDQRPVVSVGRPA